MARLTQPSHHALAARVERLDRGLRKLSRMFRVVELGWLPPDPPNWRWPTFSPSPQRPFDWRRDGV